MTIQDRIKVFRDEFGMSVTAFCRRVGISATTYYTLMSGNILSDETMERVNTYLRKYNF